MRWNLDLHAHQQIAVSIALHVFDTLAFKAKDHAGLGARGHFDLGRIGQRRDCKDAPQRGLRKTAGDIACQIVPFATENLVALDVQNDV